MVIEFARFTPRWGAQQHMGPVKWLHKQLESQDPTQNHGAVAQNSSGGKACQASPPKSNDND
jgi:hypothetical protein